MNNQTPSEKLNFETTNYLATDTCRLIKGMFPFSLNEQTQKAIDQAVCGALNKCILGVADNCIVIAEHWGEQHGNDYCASMISADINSRVEALREVVKTPTAATSPDAAD